MLTIRRALEQYCSCLTFLIKRLVRSNPKRMQEFAVRRQYWHASKIETLLLKEHIHVRFLNDEKADVNNNNDDA